MIGGGMLLCAVGAMILLAIWSLKRDELPDMATRDGILALRSFVETKKYKTKDREEMLVQDPSRPRAVKKLKQLRFDANEMAEIEDEAEQNMPKFLRDAREEY